MSIRHDWNEESPEKFDASLAKQRLEEKYRIQNVERYLKERKGVDISDIESSARGFWYDLGRYMKDKEQLSAFHGKENPSSFDRQNDRGLADEYENALRWNVPTESPKDDAWMDKIDQILRDRFDRYKPTKKELSVAELKQMKDKKSGLFK